MNIIDTNGVSYIFDKGLTLKEEYYLAPDVVDEVEVTQLVHNRKLPSGILDIENTDEYDELIYIGHYKQVINSYKKRSFYNMTGFGDVSIISTLHMLMDVFARQKTEQLFETSDSIIVFTDDENLTTEINKIFAGKSVTVKPVSDIK